MVKWSAVILGFILSIIVQVCFSKYEFIGLLIVGLIVGYLAKKGALGGMWNAAVTGALGTIIASILFVILMTIGGTYLGGILGGLSGFTISGLSSIVVVLLDIIKYMITMGIAGAVGGYIAGKDHHN